MHAPACTCLLPSDFAPASSSVTACIGNRNQKTTDQASELVSDCISMTGEDSEDLSHNTEKTNAVSDTIGPVNSEQPALCLHETVKI